MSTAESVNTAVFEEGLCRIIHVAGALECERAFLSPCSSFLTFIPEEVFAYPIVRPFVLRYLSSQVEQCRTHACAIEMRDHMRAIRVDAQASAQRTGKGAPDISRSNWFALQVTNEDFPWIHERDNTPSRVISTSGALAGLIALKLKYGEEPSLHTSRITVSATITDNKKGEWGGPQQVNT